jgi:cyclophilin family peptidyl-prolyl cis-trans isomerase
MAKQQTKKRRRRYAPGSAYAGDVKPTGILSFMNSPQTIRVVFIAMAFALVAGGAATIFGSGFLSGGGGNSGGGQSFVDQGDDSIASQPEGSDDGEELKRYASPPSMAIDTSKTYTATIKTELGDIEVELLADQAPATVNNFVFLARDGFYDGLDFHFVTQGFSAQAGDPSGTGAGGPGYELDQEAPGTFDAGTLGMVNGSQFFIALVPSEQFEEFTPFGQIISGLDVVDQLAIGTPIETIEIQES